MFIKLILCVIVILQLSTLTYCYVEALTANLDNGLTHFQPMIAMLCGQHGKFHNQYLNEQKQWITDNDPSATCIKDKLEILEYCRKVYPKKDIRNIVESNHYYKIENWKYVKTARHRSTTNDKQHFVKPIRCLEGNFQSDALLVPEHCVFDHIHNSSVCEANAYWNKTANQSCKDKGKMLQSYAMLLPCGVGIFNGVEFVCCPASTSNSQNEISDKPINSETPEFNLPAYPSIDKPKTNERLIKSNNKKLLNKKQRLNKLDQEEEDDDNSSMEDDSDDYWDQQNNKNDDESNNGINNKEQDTLPKKGKKLPKANNQEEDDDDYEEDSDDDYHQEQDYKSASTTTTTTTTTTETPLEHYYSHFDSKNEHNLYKLAEESLKKIQLDKMKKVFKDYAEFQTRLSEKNIKKSKKNQKKSSRLNDESEIDENLRKKMEKRYEDALESLEVQNNEEKQQLNAMHQQRVLTLINMKKQEATDCYTSSLNQTPLKPRKIQKCLEKLMKSLEKDRIHTLHHYKHLLQASSKLALREKAATLTHLENLIVIANRSISMLNKYPTLNDKIRNHIIAFWHNLRGVPFNQVISRETEQQIMEKYEEEIAQKQQEKEHRKMLEEVKKEEEHELVAKKEQTKDEQQEQKTNQQSTSKQNPSPSTASIEEKNGANKINASSNIKYTARYTANSKQPIKQIGKQVNQLHQQIKPIVSNMQHSKQHHEISSFKLIEQLPEQNHLTGYKMESKHSLMNYSIAGVVIVLLATVCGIIIYRSGHQSSHLSQGFVALHQQQQQSQQINNEQEHVESLQINGYENPTYKYLEKNGI